MRIVYAGTPAFAAVALQALLDAGHEVPLVLTQPDRPAGRGMKLQRSAVGQLADRHGVPLCQPRGLRLDGRYAEEAAEAQQRLLAVQPDLMVVAAYGLLLPAWVLTLPRLGCWNIHASLLPRWRGAAPIHRAIEAGDTCSGVTLMQMDEGLDTGGSLKRVSCTLSPDETTASLHDRLAGLGAGLLLEALLEVQVSPLTAVPQPAEGVCYAHKIDKAEGEIQWSGSSAVWARRARAFDPFPGLFTHWKGETLKVWAAADQGIPAPHETAAAPGTVLSVDDAMVRVRCADGVLGLLALQKAGGRRLSVADFRRGSPIQAGDCLGLACS